MKNIKYFKCYIVVFMLVAFGLQTHGQSATVVKGPSYKMSKINWVGIDPIGEDEAGYYYLLHPFLRRDKGCFIGRTSQKDMKLEEIKNLELTYGKSELELQFGFELGGTSYIFTSFQNNKLQKVFLFAHALDRVGLVENGDPIPVAEIDYSKFSKYKITSFSYRLSPDRSKVLFLHNLLDNDKSLLASGFTVADQQLKPLDRTSEISFDEAGVYQFEDYYLSDSGTVFMLTKYFDKKKDYRTSVNMKKQALLSRTRFWEEEANFDYKITEIGKGGTMEKTLTLGLPTAFITQVDLTTKDDGGILCLGFYSENEDAIPDGVFSQEINSQMIVTSTDKKGLEGKFDQPLKYVNNTYNGRGLFDKRDDLTNFRFTIKKIIEKKGGGYAFAAERNTTLSKTVNNTPNSTITYGVYHTDDIVLVDVRDNGKINWVNQIEKSQETISESRRFASFAFEEHNNNLLLFFTDFVQQNLKITGKVVDTESVVVIVRPDGTSTKQVLFTETADKLTIMVDKIVKTSHGDFVLYGNNGMFLVGFYKVTF